MGNDGKQNPIGLLGEPWDAVHDFGPHPVRLRRITFSPREKVEWEMTESKTQ